MPNGLSTRAVGAPIGTAGSFSPAQRIMRVVPLSAFFLDADEEDADDPDALTGFRRKKKTSSDAKRPERVNKDRDKDKNGKGPDSSGGMTGGNAASADAANAGKRQSTAGAEKQESATMATGTPLIAPGGSTRSASFPGGASKLGATHASTGATSSGNVAQYPGARRRRRKKQESLSRWIDRLGKMAL